MNTRKFFYITAKDTNRIFFMAGPFKEHEEALELVDSAMQAAAEIDPRSWWMDWGTIGCDDTKSCPLNDAFNVKSLTASSNLVE